MTKKEIEKAHGLGIFIGIIALLYVSIVYVIQDDSYTKVTKQTNNETCWVRMKKVHAFSEEARRSDSYTNGYILDSTWCIQKEEVIPSKPHKR